MEALAWALNAAALLVLVYAVRVILQGRDPEHPGKKAGLGCGFFFIACLLWSLASAGWVGGYLNAFRLGMGVFLVTPAIGALTKPHGSRLFLGLVGLILGIVVGGPVVKNVWTDTQTRIEEGPRVEHEQLLGQLQEKRATLDESLNDWMVRRLELKTAVQDSGHADYAALSQDAEAVAQLQDYNEVSGRVSWAQDQLRQIDQKIGAVEAALAAMQEDASSPSSDLEALGFELPEAPRAEELTPVEDYARQKKLQAVFEAEFE